MIIRMRTLLRSWSVTLGEVNVPPGLFQNYPMGITRAYEMDGDSDADSAAELQDYIGNDTIFSTILIGRRATVGGSEGRTDWLCAPGAVDNPPGGVWIDFIRRTVGDSQSIVAVPVTGSLVSPTLFSHRDADFGYRYSRDCINCDTDWILPARYQVLLIRHTAGGTMDADGFSIVDNRAGVTFGVELYVPWYAPEMAIDIEWYGATAKRSGRFRDEWSSGQCDRESHSTRERCL